MVYNTVYVRQGYCLKEMDSVCMICILFDGEEMLFKGQNMFFIWERWCLYDMGSFLRIGLSFFGQVFCLYSSNIVNRIGKF